MKPVCSHGNPNAMRNPSGAGIRPSAARTGLQHLRRTAIAAVLAVAGALSPGAAGAADAPSALVANGKSIIRSLSHSVFTLLRDESDRRKQEATFRTLFAMYFDVPRIARFVLGRAAWSKATAEEREQFLNLFQQYVVRVYAVQLRRHRKGKFEIVAAGPDRNGVFVTSRMVGLRSGRPFHMKWRLRPSGGTLKVRDMVFENVSMSINQRREFASAYRRHGGTMAGLLRAIRTKMAELDRQ
ncbi:MAG: ABC transporter substrate-binding protein [Rhodospirillaceae bacterium]|nr:ABC transporter substrate-binding protein [Rhodospirillaceae bacterium]